MRRSFLSTRGTSSGARRQPTVSLFLVLFMLAFATVVVDGIVYSVTANFELTPYASSRFARFYTGTNSEPSSDTSSVDDLQWDMRLPQESLTSYYVQITDAPFTIDTGGTITISLSTTQSPSDGDSNDGGDLPEFASSTYLAYAQSFLITAAQLNEGTTEAVWNTNHEFFFLNQPRLHCLLNAPLLTSQVSEVSGAEDVCANVDSPTVDASTVASNLINDLYMVNDAVLELKVFQWDVWYSLTEHLQLNNKTVQSLTTQEIDDILIAKVQSEQEPYNLLIDSAMVCSAPAMYTVGINNLISAASEAAGSSSADVDTDEWPTTIVITHGGTAQRIVAVLAQCSTVPVTVRLDVTFTNPHNVSATLETYYTTIMYFVFMAAYALLFVIYLTLIISCKRRQSKSEAAPRTKEKDTSERGTRAASESPNSKDKRSPRRHRSDREEGESGGEDGETGSRASEGEGGHHSASSRSSRSRGNFPESASQRTEDSAKKKMSKDKARDKKSARDGASSSSSRASSPSRSRSHSTPSRRKHASPSSSSPHRRRKAGETDWRDHDDDDDDDARGHSSTCCGCVCCDRHAPNIFTRLRKSIVHLYHNYTIIVMADGRMQWLVFVSIPVKCLMCVFFAASYAVINTGGLITLSGVGSLPFVSLALGVAIGTILFALELLVAVGWGLAFKSVTTAQIVILSIGCILFFVFDICVVSTCPVNGRLDAFTMNSYAREQSNGKCISFQYIKYAIMFVYHVYNAVQLFLVTRLLGHRAVKEHRDILLHGKIPTTVEAYKGTSGSAAHRRRLDEDDEQKGRGSRAATEQQRRQDRKRERERKRREKSQRRRERGAGTETNESETNPGSGSDAEARRRRRRRAGGGGGSGRGDDPDTLHSFGSTSSDSVHNDERTFSDRDSDEENDEEDAWSESESLSDSGSHATSSTETETETETETSSHTFSTSSDSEMDSSDDVDDVRRRGGRRRTAEGRAGRLGERQTTSHTEPVAAEGSWFPVEAVAAHTQAARHSVDAMKVFLRYHGMRYPFLFIVIWQLMFLCLSLTMYQPEHYYMKIFFEEIGYLYLLCFIILFFRKEPFYC